MDFSQFLAVMGCFGVPETGNGAQGRNRTTDTAIFSEPDYRFKPLQIGSFCPPKNGDIVSRTAAGPFRSLHALSHQIPRLVPHWYPAEPIESV
jgi:hypothetical protein